MSADNFIAVEKQGDKWRVYMDFDSGEYEDIPEDAWTFDTYEAALKAAHEWAGEEYCEYGVRVIGHIKENQ